MSQLLFLGTHLGMLQHACIKPIWFPALRVQKQPKIECTTLHSVLNRNFSTNNAMTRVYGETLYLVKELKCDKYVYA